MNNCKFILIPSADSVPGTNARFTKGNRYDGEPCNQYSSTMLYRIIDDNGKAYVVNPKGSSYIGGNHFSVEVQFNNICARGGLTAGGYVHKKSGDAIFGAANIGGAKISASEFKIEPTVKVCSNLNDDIDNLLKQMVRGGFGWADRQNEV
ncbi:hypothetical protein [Enterobacter phage F20]|uniref:Uncharacterized protein n=1 Tax=Enterobacter phage F20 TaxID=2886900 RepID=G5DMK9_9CAUD|nr:hypothetical protein FLA17_gp64 [Enterobacter phage F20]AEQ39237.1 hypothetical protein [Enterobacter phage F20]